MMKLSIYLTVLFFFFPAFLLTAQEPLDRYLQWAAENNAGLQSRFNDYYVALSKVDQAGVLPDPKASFGYFIQPVETRLGPQTYNVSVTQFFPWFGTLSATENAAAQRAKEAFQQFEEARSRLFYDIRAVYYDLYFLDRSVKIMNEHITLLNRLNELVTVKVEAGESSLADQFRIEMNLLDQEDQLVLLKDQLQDKKVELKNLINKDKWPEPVHVPSALIYDSLVLSKESIWDSIRANNQQLQALEFREARYVYREKEEQRAGRPSFSLGVDYIGIGERTGIDGAGKDAIVFPKVGISIPLYRKKYSARVEEMALQQKIAQNDKIDKLNHLEVLFQETYTEYEDSKRKIDLHQRQLKLAGKALDLLQTGYATGKEEFDELISMERELLRHKIEIVKAKHNRQSAFAFLNYLMGR